MKSRTLLSIIGILVLVGAVAGGALAWRLKHPKGAVREPQVQKKNEPALPPQARIMFVGDLMVDRGVENSVTKNLGGDFNRLFENLGILKEADFAFVNIEGPVTDKGPDVGSRFSFAMNEKILPALVANNFKIASLANNHAGDRSMTGFVDTMANLNKYGLPFTGAGNNRAEALAPRIVEANGLKIGFIGCTDVGPTWLGVKDASAGIVLCSDSQLMPAITAARDQVDFLVFTAHWGAEYKPKNERQQTLAHQAVDAGADMVIGHHPHVIEETEWYNGKFIAYSLGNFIFDQYFSDETMQGLLVDATIEKHAIKNVSLKVIELSKDTNKYQPKEVRDATDKDFIKRGTVAAQTCPVPKNNSTNPDYWLVPVGPDRGVDDYVPSNLVPMNNRMDVQTTANCLIERAADALERMVVAMEKDGLDIIMTSGYRSKSTQEIVRDGSADTAAADADPTKYPSVALPGHSEHQLGVAVDMKSGSDPAFSYDNFKNSKEYAWLLKNAADYGFVQSYQVGKEPITGYTAEAWHWRYVGTTHAKNILAQGITPYEYLKNLEISGN